MIKKFDIGGLQCLTSTAGDSSHIAYILYPMDMLGNWIETAAAKYGVTITVITGMDWESVFSPWSAPGVPPGSPDFKGKSPEFLKKLQDEVIPQLEARLGIAADVQRSLVGVSMSGLFALWQWMLCDTFYNIASLSGSFWYEGFLDWMKSHPIPAKTGKGFFLLGDQEKFSGVKAFRSVGENTDQIIKLLSHAGIDVEFESVPGNHFSDALPRLEKAFTALYSNIKQFTRLN